MKKFVSFVFLVCTLLVASARAEPPPISAYGVLPQVADGALSRSGKRIALVATINKKQVLLISEIDGKALNTVDISSQRVRGVEWAGDDFVVVITSTTQNLGMEYGFKYELYNGIVYDVERRTLKPLINNLQRRYLSAVFGLYGFAQVDGKWSVYTRGVPLEKSSISGNEWIGSSEPHLVRIELQSGEIKKVTTGLRNTRDWLIDLEGNVLAHSRYEPHEKKWMLYDGKDRDRKLVELDDVYADSELLGRGRTAGTLLYAAVDDNGSVHHMEVQVDKPEQPQELFPDIRIRRFVFDPQTRLLAGYIKEGDAPELVMFDAKKMARVVGTRKAFPGKWTSFASWSDDLNRMLVHTNGIDDSGTWWIVDIATGKANEMGWDYPAIKSQFVNPFRVLKYKAQDGLAMEGVLTLPKGLEEKNLPLVVMPHGGPEARDYPMFDWMAQAFASRGYAVWQPNFRGSSGYTAAFRNAGFGEWGRKMQTDITDGVEELVRLGVVDRGRMCTVGASYGGYAALAGITVQQGFYRCAVSVAGVADLRGMLDRSAQRNVAAMRYWRRFMGAGGIFDRTIDNYSPASLAKNASAPVMLIHGKDDLVVPIEQSKRMLSALKSEDKPVEFVELPGEDHYLSKQETRQAMLEASVAFVVKHNPPGNTAN